MLERKMFNGFFAFALVAALVMAGCGGGGGGSSSSGMTGMEQPTPGDMEAMKLSEAKEAAMTAYMAAKDAFMAVEADKDADVESYVRAEFAVADAKAASDKAQAAETVEMAEQYQTMAEAAQTEVEMHAGMVTAAHNKMVMDDMADAAMVAMTKAANTKRAAIMKLGKGISGGGMPSTTPNEYIVKRKDGAVSEIDDPLSFPSVGDPSFKNMDDKWVRDNGDGTTEVVSANTFGRGSGSRQSFLRKYINHMTDSNDAGTVPETLIIGGRHCRFGVEGGANEGKRSFAPTDTERGGCQLCVFYWGV